MGRAVQRPLQLHYKWAENHKMLLSVFLYRCLGQRLLCARIQVVVHHIPWKLKPREDLLLLLDSLCLERQLMHLKSWRAIEIWETSFFPRAGLGSWAKMKLNCQKLRLVYELIIALADSWSWRKLQELHDAVTCDTYAEPTFFFLKLQIR